MDEPVWKKEVTLKVYQCLRCGHDWLPRITTRPKQCPRCKQPSWWQKSRKVIPRPNKRTRDGIYLDENGKS